MKKMVKNIRTYGAGAVASVALMTAAGAASAQVAAPSAAATAVEAGFDQMEYDVLNVYGPALVALAVVAAAFFIGMKFIKRGTSSV